MSVRLCQDCSQWIWSKSGCCSDCGNLADEAIDPDLVARRFRSLIGAAGEQLGHVRIARRKLPTDGLLYSTEHGLFFLPHRTVTAQRLVEENQSSVLWQIAAAAWAPLHLILPFVKSKRVSIRTVHEQEPIRLGEDNLHLLPDLLPRMPGAFFLAAKDVATVRSSRKRWLFERTNGSQIKIEPLSEQIFAQRMNQLLATEKWRSITEL